MAKKINGIKVYPRYSVGSILSAVFCIASGLAIVFASAFLPVYTIGGFSMTGLDFTFLAFNKLNVIDASTMSISENFHLFNKEKFDMAFCIEKFQACCDQANISSNFAVSWLSEDIFKYVVMAIGFSSILVVLLGVFLFIKGVVRVILGTYPKHSKSLSISSFIVYFFTVIGIFVLSFVTKYLTMEVVDDPSSPLFELTVEYSSWPYIAWGIMLVSFVAQCWIKTLLVKGKLYVAGARKIKKSKEIDN